MKKQIFFGLLLIGAFSIAQAAGIFTDRYPSARLAAMGGSGVAIVNDAWAAFYNPAGLSRLNGQIVSTAYSRLFNVHFLKNFFGAAATPLPAHFGNIAVGFEYFGVDFQGKNISGEYTLALSHGFYLLKDIHSSLAVGYSLKILHWTLGASPQFGELGSASTLGIDLGFQASVYQRTYVGFAITNINTPQIGKYTKYDLPQRIIVGLAYQPYEGVTTSLDFHRIVGSQHTQVWGGTEFQIIPHLTLRFGATTHPNRFTAGAGIRYRFFQLDYAFITHNELGDSHLINVTVWKK